MLVQFSVENYKSFKDERTFSFLSTSDTSLLENTFEVNDKARLNKTSVIYGANASGKSNVFKALTFFFKFAVFSGPNTQAGDKTGTKPFIFSDETVNEPSSFELIFYIPEDGRPIRYRYGFSVNSHQVVQEYLYAVNNVRESELFYRENQKIDVSPVHFKEGKRNVGAVRENASFLSVCAQANGEISRKIVAYFRNFTVIAGYSDRIIPYSMDEIYSEKHDRILNFLHFADLQIKDFRKVEEPQDPSEFESVPDPDIREFLIKKISGVKRSEFHYGHPFFRGKEEDGTAFIDESEESRGTNKLFGYAPYFFEILDKGGVLCIDEFDSSLHPIIVENLIQLFNSPVTNPHNAQLLVSCHTTNIMNNELLRRDQIWFCEKDRFGATDLYSLSDYKVRKDASYSKNYLYGKYGGIPSVRSGLMPEAVDYGKE